MPVDTTASGFALSPAYRHAQRVLAQWLEHGPAGARRARLVWRTVSARLNTVEHDRLLRWLAWWRVAANSRADAPLTARLQHLDAVLEQAITHAMRTLPGQRHEAHGQWLPLSA